MQAILVITGFFPIEITDVLSYRNLYNKVIFKQKNKLFKNLSKCLQ